MALFPRSHCLNHVSFLGPEGDLVISLKPRREAEPSRKVQPSGEAAEVGPIKESRERKQTPTSEQTEPPKERRVAAKKAASGLLESDQDLFSEYYSIVEISVISNLLLCSYDLIVFHIFAGSGDEYEPSKKERKECKEEMEEDVDDEQREKDARGGNRMGPAPDLTEVDSARGGDQRAPELNVTLTPTNAGTARSEKEPTPHASGEQLAKEQSVKKKTERKHQLRTRIRKAGKGEQQECPTRVAEGSQVIWCTGRVKS